MRIPSNVGDKNSAQRNQWRSALLAARAIVRGLGVPCPALPASFRGMMRPLANTTAATIIDPYVAVASAQGVAVGSGPITLSRMASIGASLYVTAQEVAADAAAEGGFGGGLPGAGLTPQGSNLPAGPPRQQFSLPGFSPTVGGYSAGSPSFAPANAGGGMYTEEGQLLDRSLGQRLQGDDGLVLQFVLDQNAAEVRAGLSAIDDHGDLEADQMTGGYTPGKLAAVGRLVSLGWVESLRIKGTPGDTVSVFVDPSLNGSSTWDDTDNATAVTTLTGSVVSIIIPEDGWAVIKVRRQSPIIGLKQHAAGNDYDFSVFRDRAHAVQIGADHFGLSCR